MIALPAVAALVALACAAVVGRDAVQRPKPERVMWTIAFAVFALAAGSEVAGSVAGWNPTLTRVYYLSGAVLVVGLLALGELYLLLPRRMPAVTPGLALLAVAIAVTAVWTAPVDEGLLRTHGWEAIERGPLLIAVAIGLNAGGTLVLVAGALYSAWRLHDASQSRNRALGCIAIALGTVLVAAGGTLTRFGHREYLYIPMALGIVVIFAGVLLTRGRSQQGATGALHGAGSRTEDEACGRARLIPLPQRRQVAAAANDAGIAFIENALLKLDDNEIAVACRGWSATALEGDVLSREQAKQVWSLRLALASESQARFDALSLPVQAQLAELRGEVWVDLPRRDQGRRGA